MNYEKSTITLSSEKAITFKDVLSLQTVNLENKIQLKIIDETQKLNFLEIYNELIKNVDSGFSSNFQHLELLGEGNSLVDLVYDLKLGFFYAKKTLTSLNLTNIIIEIYNMKIIVINVFKCPRRFVSLHYQKMEKDYTIPKKNEKYPHVTHLLMDNCEGTLENYIDELKEAGQNLFNEDLKHVYNNIFLVIKELIECIKIMKNNGFIHSDIKPKNICFKVLNGANTAELMMADFFTLISLEEHKRFKIIRGYSPYYYPPDLNPSLEGVIFSDNEFFGIDIYGFCQTILELLKECLILKFTEIELKKINELNILFNNFKKNYKQYSIIDIENEFKKYENFNLEPIIDNTIIIPLTILRKIISKKLYKDKKLIRKYISLGYYNKPLYLIDIITETSSEDDLIEAAIFYESIGQYELCLKYLEKYEKTLIKNDPSYLLKICISDCLRGNCYNKLALKINSKNLISKILENIKKITLNLKDHRTQSMIINLLYFLNENFENREVEKLIKRIDFIIEESTLEPKMNKKITDDDDDNLNDFFLKYYNMKSLHIRYTQGNMNESYNIMLKVLKIQETVTFEYCLPRAEMQNNLGNAAELIGNFDLALKYYSRSYEIRQIVFNNSAGVEISEKKLIIPQYNMMRMLLKSKNPQDHKKAYETGKVILKKRESLSGNKNYDIEVFQARRLVGQAAFSIKKYFEAFINYYMLIRYINMEIIIF